MIETLKSRARALKNEVVAIYIAAKDPRTPWYAKALIFFVVAHTFSPDGTRLATGGRRDHTLLLYVLKIDDLIALARSRLTRSLTTEECQKYLHVEACPAEP